MSRKKRFIYINVNYNDSYRRKTTCTFLYKQKAKKNAKRLYIYTKIQTLCKNQDNFLGAMDRQKRDVPTEIFSQGLKKSLAREREKPLQIFLQGREEPAEIQPFR